MALFGKSKPAGFMDVIRCDEPTYLIWKWHPAGLKQGRNGRENTIRWGSSLRVKDGEVAAFVYEQENGIIQDFIEGPFDDILETQNLPVLASIIGLAYNGDTPFQAEVYFINLARIIQVPFAVPYFDLFDSRFPDIGVPTAIRGTISFNITDYRAFIKTHRLTNFELNDFQSQVKDAVTRYVKGVVAGIPAEKNTPLIQIETQLPLINETVEERIKERFQRDYAVNVSAVDISAVDVDKSSSGYQQLMAVTRDLSSVTAHAQTQVNIKNMQDMQRINAENTEESLRIKREEEQYAQHKQTQTVNMAAFQVEQQAAVGIAGADALAQMGINGATEMSGSGMNPAGMMVGMAMGSAIGQNLTGMMNSTMSAASTPQFSQGMTPPPVPKETYHVVQNGKDTGPFDVNELAQLVATGKLTRESLVWKQGMSDWIKAGVVKELSVLFTEPNVPPIPNT